MPTTTPTEIPNEWEFYPCVVDDEPASILLNMWYRGNYEGLAFETLYYGRIDMLDPDDHGMGSKNEAEVLFRIEDVITGVLAQIGLVNVGRLRTDRGWQLSFYGDEGLEPQLDRAFSDALSERSYAIGAQPDPEWSYYHEFLYPDRERLQWITNRHQVQTMLEHGDDVEAERPIDHLICFNTPESRDQFALSLESNGFSNYSKKEHSGEPGDPYMVEVMRADAAELGHIHDVVMDLAILAEKFGGDYDGWGAPIVDLDDGPDSSILN